MKSILVIHHGAGIGGGLIALVGMVRELQQKYTVKVLCIFNSDAVQYLKDHDIDVVVANNAFYSKFYDLFIHSEASFVNFANVIRTIKNIFLFAMNMVFFSRRELRNWSKSYDYLYLNSLFISDWLFWGKRYFSKTFIHVREPLAKGVFGLRKLIIRSIIRRFADKIISISNDNAQRVDLLDKTSILYDPVLERKDRSVFNPSNYRTFVYVGGSQRIKGFEVLMRCLEFLNDNVRILFIGGTYELDENPKSIKYRLRSVFSKYLRKELPQLQEIYRSTDKLIKIGTVDNVFNYYGSSLALLAPFAKPHACLPILEAMSIGLPCIISDVEGMDEFPVKSEIITFTSTDPLEFAKVINRFAGMDEASLKAMGALNLKRYNKIRSEQRNILNVIGDDFQ